MSDYSRFKCLRYPITEADYDRIDRMTNYMGYREIKGCGYFETTRTDKRVYLDYILKHTYGDECGEFGYTRALKDCEQDSFKHLFAQFFPDIDMKLVRLVDYCWYNCCEPPDYYSPEEDPFYDTISAPSARWLPPYEGVYNKYLRCSNCASEFEASTARELKYCPTCGALIEKLEEV